LDILLDEVTHDVVWNNGPLTKEFTTQPYTQTVSQRLKIRLLNFKGEWFMDLNYGPPYWQEILAMKVSKSRVDRIFQQQILLENGVREIVSFSSTLINRQYSLKFQVKVVSGEVTAPILISPVI